MRDGCNRIRAARCCGSNGTSSWTGCVGLPRISNFVSLGLRHTIATATLKAAKWTPAVVHDAIANIKSLEVAIELLGPAPLVIGFRAAHERSKVGRQFIESRNVLRANGCQGCRAESNFQSRSCTGQVVATSLVEAVLEPVQVKLQTQIGLLVRERDALKSRTSQEGWWCRRVKDRTRNNLGVGKGLDSSRF